MTETGHDTGPAISPGPPRPGQPRNALVETLRAAVAEAPLVTPVMPRTGRPFTVRMTNLGALGWVSDRAGYRYQPTHPETGRPWPAMPAMVLEVWRASYRATRMSPRPALSISTTAAPRWACTGTRTRRISPPPSSRSRWATRRCSASGGPERGGKTRELQALLRRRAGDGGRIRASATTASTGS